MKSDRHMQIGNATSMVVDWENVLICLSATGKLGATAGDAIGKSQGGAMTRTRHAVSHDRGTTFPYIGN